MRETNELILLEGIGDKGFDEFIVVSGERIETQADPNFYPFTHAVTFRLCPEDAARIGQEVITVAESAILQDCELPKDCDLPKAAELPPVAMSKTGQLTLFSDTDPQPTLF